MSILPSNYPKEWRALDEALGKLVAKSFKMPFKHFYNPTENPHLALLAHSFGVDLDTKLPIHQQQAQLESPLLKKIYLGTERGIKEAVFKVFGEVRVVTFANQAEFDDGAHIKNALKPFEYFVTIAPNSKSTMDMERAIKAIQAIQPARDRFKWLKIDFPLAQWPYSMMGTARVRCDFSGAMRHAPSARVPLSLMGGARICPTLRGRVVYSPRATCSTSFFGGARFFLTFHEDQRRLP
ncbi:phage tail protein [Helicobacter felis]|uniref:phage tail protein n=1 Tax=Helicobacter felis TaxID=214 RepID=UPI000CF037BD|nr:phage tail protein [Helicobacter felis]